MKKYISLTLQSFCLILGVALFSACSGENTVAHDGSGEDDDKEYFYLTFLNDSLFEHKEVRATVPGVGKENEVQRLTVMLFDRTTGEKKNISGFANPYTFNVVSPVATEWMNDNPATKTVKLLISRTQAENLVVYAFSNLTPGVLSNLSAVTNLSELPSLWAYYSFVALNPRSNLGQQMVGRIETTADSVKDSRIFVPMIRTTAKVNIVLHFGYDEMVKDEAFTYQYKDFKYHHYLIVNDGIQRRQDSLPNSNLKTPTQFDRPQDTVTLGPFYINAYDISATPDVTAPYVLFDFLARRPIAKSTDIPIGWLPPPAGGEHTSEGYVQRRHYYRLVMPRVIKRNTHYVIHAYFLGEGGYTPEGTNVASMSFSVLDWVLGTTAPIQEF